MVDGRSKAFTAETQRAQRLRREEFSILRDKSDSKRSIGPKIEPEFDA
jgi:hypothetical protein